MMVTITRTLAATFAMTAVLAPGFAAPAHADPPLLNGTYAVDGGSDGFTWTIASECAASGCTANVVSNRGWTTTAKLTDGRWNFVVTKPDGVICDDGSYAPAFISFSIDPATLDGIISNDSNYSCPGGQITQTPFKLKKIG